MRRRQQVHCHCCRHHQSQDAQEKVCHRQVPLIRQDAGHSSARPLWWFQQKLFPPGIQVLLCCCSGRSFGMLPVKETHVAGS